MAVIRGWQFVLLIMFARIALPVMADETSGDRAGGHPLAGRHGGLAELLEQADWPAGKQTSSAKTAPNRSTQAAAQEPEAPPPVEMQRPMMRQVQPARDVTTAFRNLLQERHRLVDQCRLFNTLREIQEKEPILQQERRNLEASQRIVNNRRQAVALLQRQMVASQMPQIRAALSGQLNAATVSLRSAELDQQEAVRRVEAADRNVRPLYERLSPVVDAWIRCYREAREYFPRNRLDAVRSEVLPILEDAIADRHDFHEGRVLAAIGAAYEKDTEVVAHHLSRARDELDRHGLTFTIIGEDLCRACVDAGMPGEIGDKVAAFVTKKLDRLAITQQTPVRYWLSASCFVKQGKFAEAKTRYDRGITKLKQAKQSECDDPLVGDAALLYLACRSQLIGDQTAAIKKAREVLALAPVESECFEVIRARAALAAADGDWEAAIELIDESGKRSPPALDADIKAQREAYAQKRVWIIERKNKK